MSEQIEDTAKISELRVHTKLTASIPDAALLKSIEQGDDQAMGQLFDRHSGYAGPIPPPGTLDYVGSSHS